MSISWQAVSTWKNTCRRNRPCNTPGAGKYVLDVLFDAEAAAHLRETRLSARQTLRYCPDGRVRVTARVRDTQQLRWWLLGFGDLVEVIGPETLREEFAETAWEMHRLYRK